MAIEATYTVKIGATCDGCGRTETGVMESHNMNDINRYPGPIACENWRRVFGEPTLLLCDACAPELDAAVRELLQRLSRKKLETKQ